MASWRCARLLCELPRPSAIAHSIVTAIWHMLADHEPYHDLGGTHFAGAAVSPAAALAMVFKLVESA